MEVPEVAFGTYWFRQLMWQHGCYPFLGLVVSMRLFAHLIRTAVIADSIVVAVVAATAAAAENFSKRKIYFFRHIGSKE